MALMWCSRSRLFLYHDSIATPRDKAAIRLANRFMRMHYVAISGDADRIPSDSLVADRVNTLKSTFSRWLKARQALAAALPKEQGDAYDFLTADIHSRMVGKLEDIIPYENW